MSGTRTSIVSTAALLITAAACQGGAEYFPLQTGNSWVYRVTQGRMARPATVEVEARETLEGREYFRVRFFERVVHLRAAEDGSLLAWDANSKQERVWLPFAAEEGQSVETAFDGCSKVAKVATRDARVKSQIGEFDGVLQLTYAPNCADAGTTMQQFLPYVGMLTHETTSIAGPVRYELVYSRTGVTTIDAKTNAFTIALDSKQYKAADNAVMLARLTLRVTEPVKLTFPSAQNADLRILDEKGSSVYVWSADKLFAQVFRPDEEIGPGERSFALEAPLGALAPGRYTVEGWLATQPRMYSGAISFEIVR